MFRSLNYFCAIFQLGCYILPIYAVTNFDSGTKSDTFVFELPKFRDAQSLLSRVSSLSASGRTYGETTLQREARNPSSANGRILSQPTTSDKDSITYPDDIIRDSYGNIVTPYTLLEDTSSPKPSGIGLLTDVNKDKGQHLQFVIPSYSDGITELQGPYKPSSISAAIAPPIQTLLPPLSSGNYNYPSLGTAYKPSADNSYQNEIGGSFSPSALTNPVPTGPTAITTNGHIGSPNNTPSVYTPSSQVPSAIASQSNSYDQQSGVNVQPTPSQPTTVLFSKSSFASLPNNPQGNGVVPLHGSSDFSAIQISSPEPNAPSSTFSFSNTKPQKDTQFVNQIPIQIQVDGGKYTGGFGGAPGILGEQKIPGYAVKPTSNTPSISASIPQVNNSHPASNSIQAPNTAQDIPNRGTQNLVPNVSHQTVSSNQYHQENATPTKPINLNPSGTFGPSNTNHGSFQFGTAISANPTQIINSGKYTGGFGGPPGILAPFDNLKTGQKAKY